MITPVTISKSSPFLGEECALCKELLSPGEQIVVCPQDSTRHHVHCWQANGNACTAYGCTGTGVVGTQPEARRRRRRTAVFSNLRHRFPRLRRFLSLFPLGCAQSCLIASIALAIVVIAFSCFGLWAIADYIMIERLGWFYRDPLSMTGTLFIAFIP